MSGIALAGMASRRADAEILRKPSRVYEYGRSLSQFEYSQVSLEDGLHQAQLENAHSVLMGLSEDSLLKPYRSRAGLHAPGCDLNGWYSSESFGAETFGQWISALSRYYAISADETTREKVDRLVRGFAETIEPTGKLYGDARVTTGPAYMYDKLTCGLMDAHQFAGQAQALEILAKAASAVEKHLPGRAVDYRESDTGAHESYTLPENQFIAWQRGASERHLEMAQQYLYHSFFEPLSRGDNVLAGRHAYSHVNSLCSAAKAYLILGEQRYLDAAVNGFAFVEAQSYATGGWGPNETFVPSPAISWGGIPEIANLAESLPQSHRHFETPCGSFAHFKLTRYLLRITRNPAYGDSMERVMYNSILGAKALLADGRAFYQSDYHPFGHKEYFDGFGGLIPAEWPCCSGTLPQIASDYRISTYFRDEAGVYVNLFIPSTVTWEQHGAKLSLTQSGSYPLSDTIVIAVGTSRPTKFRLHLRIPAWSLSPSVRVNGEVATASIQPGTFATLERQWSEGDRVEIQLPGRIELKSIDAQHPDIVAMMFGPLALFAVGTDTPKLNRQQLLSAERLNGKSARWGVETPSGLLEFAPFWDISNERYSLYLHAA